MPFAVASTCELSCLVVAPSQAVIGQPVTFALLQPPECPAEVQWQFGNGTPGIGATASTTYQSAATFTWTVIVSVNGQPSCTNTGTIQVTAQPPTTKRRSVRH
jgi:hypothetical protein